MELPLPLPPHVADLLLLLPKPIGLLHEGLRQSSARARQIVELPLKALPRLLSPPLGLSEVVGSAQFLGSMSLSENLVSELFLSVIDFRLIIIIDTN